MLIVASELVTNLVILTFLDTIDLEGLLVFKGLKTAEKDQLLSYDTFLSSDLLSNNRKVKYGHKSMRLRRPQNLTSSQRLNKILRPRKSRLPR